ncbi:hypothetical protein, partial [Escherichia coli]
LLEAKGMKVKLAGG